MDENEKSKRLERIKKEKSTKQMILLVGGITLGVLATTGFLIYRASQSIAADTAASEQATAAATVQAEAEAEAAAAPVPEKKELSEADGERLAAATVLLRVNDQGQQLQSCGFFCAPETIVTNLSVFGDCEKVQSFTGNIIVTINSGVAGKQMPLKARLTAIDKDAQLAFMKVAGTNLPQPLDFGSASSIKSSSVLLYVPGIPISKPADAPPVGITVGKAGTLSVRKSGTVLASVNASLSAAHRGAPVVDCHCRVVGMIPGKLQTVETALTVPTEDILWSLNGHVVDVALKSVSKEDSTYTFDVNADVVNPTEGPLAANFYYKTGAKDSPSTLTVPLKIDAKTSAYSGQVVVSIPRGGSLWAQMGIKLAANPELLTALYNRAAEIGVPGAIVAEAPVQPRPVYNYTPQYAQQQYRPQVQSVQQPQTVTRTVIVNAPPPPPADSPGWTFGYKTDYSTNRKSGEYETTPSGGGGKEPGVIVVTPPPAVRKR